MNTSCVLVTERHRHGRAAGHVVDVVGSAAEPVSRVINIVGAVPPVSNTKPAGALRMMVPVPTLPLAFSE